MLLSSHIAREEFMESDYLPYALSVWNDEKVLEIDNGKHCTTL